MGEQVCRDVLAFDDASLADPQFDVLARLGFSRSDIAAANVHACGTMSIESAPDLKRDPAFAHRHPGRACVPTH